MEETTELTLEHILDIKDDITAIEFQIYGKRDGLDRLLFDVQLTKAEIDRTMELLSIASKGSVNEE